MTNLIQRLAAGEHQLEAIARDGFVSATIPIVFGGIVVALFAFVALALGMTLVVSSFV
jgi:hypothetical protein